MSFENKSSHIVRKSATEKREYWKVKKLIIAKNNYHPKHTIVNRTSEYNVTLSSIIIFKKQFITNQIPVLK